MRGRSLLVPILSLLIAALAPTPPAAAVATCGGGGGLGGISGGEGGAGAQVCRVPWKVLQAGFPESDLKLLWLPASAAEARDDFTFARYLDEPAFVELTRGADSDPDSDHQSGRSGTR